MALQYPYCQPLRLLLLRKSLQENRDNWEELLSHTATRTVDRHQLHQQIAGLSEEATALDNFLLGEEYLELKSLEEEEELSLDTLQEEAPAAELDFDFSPPEAAQPGASAEWPATEEPAALPEEEPEAHEGFILPKLEDWKAQQLEQIAHELEDHPETHGPQPAPAKANAGYEQPDVLSLAVDTAIAICEALSVAPLQPVPGASAPTPPAARERMAPDQQLHTGIPKPRPKASFTSWLAQFQPPDIQTQLSSIMESKKLEEKKRKKKQKKTTDVDRIAERSITQSDDLASETLAELYIRQQQYDKAIDMYERLMLVFPEKSGFFAERIETLKKDI